MSDIRKVLRLAGSYYKLEHVSEEEFHNFISKDHAVKAAQIHERHGILHYKLAFGTSHTRELAKGLKLPWKIDDHDVTIEFYFTDVSALLAVSADEDFKALHVDTKKFICLDATTISVTWIEVYVKDGKIVNINSNGQSLQPSFAERSVISLPDT